MFLAEQWRGDDYVPAPGCAVMREGLSRLKNAVSNRPNEAATGNGAFALWLRVARLRRAVPEQIRSP